MSVKKVRLFYENYPYPLRNISSKKELQNYALWLLSGLGEKSPKFFKGKKILEAGCGTAELSNALALNKAKVFGVDISFNSLKKAIEYKKKFKLKNVYFIQADINKLPFKEKFDLIISMGAIHHNKEPKKTFESILLFLKEKGIISIGLYNKFGRLRLRLKNKLLDLIAGKDTEKRIYFAKKIFFKGKTPKQGINWLADKFAHPLEKYFSVEEVMQWFKENNIKFKASKPEIKENTLITQLKWFLRKKGAFFVMTGIKI